MKNEIQIVRKIQNAITLLKKLQEKGLREGYSEEIEKVIEGLKTITE